MINLFAHRGFVTKDSPENSIASLKSAYENGFRAVEFDIWFIDQNLVIKHDRPKKDEIKNLPNFADYFLYKNQMQYWLDFKNLNEENADLALKLTKKAIEENSISQSQIYFVPFITNYQLAENIFKKIRDIFGEEVNIVAVCEKLENAKEIEKLYEFLAKNNVKFLSILHIFLNENFIKKISNIGIFAWTIDDLARLKKLEDLGIRNFCTNKITKETYEKYTTSLRS